jgi:hypothetical protein
MRLNVSIICIAELVITFLALPCKISKYGCFAAGTPVYTDHGRNHRKHHHLRKSLILQRKNQNKRIPPCDCFKDIHRICDIGYRV